MLQHLKRWLAEQAERHRQQQINDLLGRIDHYGQMQHEARRALARLYARDVMTRLQRAGS